MKNKGILIFALLFTQQTHANLLNFSAFSDVDDPVSGWLDGYQDFSSVPSGCCISLAADVIIDTVSTGFSVVSADSYEYTYESAATITLVTEGISTTFYDMDIVLSQSRYDYSKIYFRSNIQTGSDSDFTYSANIGLFLTNYNSFGLLDGNNLLSSILAGYDGERLSYGESKLSLDPNCTIFCSLGFSAQNGGGVSLTAIETTVVPIPGALGLFMAGLTSLLFYTGKGRREKSYGLMK